nr:hypothetical protein [Massilia oculi]
MAIDRPPSCMAIGRAQQGQQGQQGGGPGVAQGDVDRTQRSAIHALERLQVTATVDYRDQAGYAQGLGPRLLRLDHRLIVPASDKHVHLLSKT